MSRIRRSVREGWHLSLAGGERHRVSRSVSACLAPGFSLRFIETEWTNSWCRLGWLGFDRRTCLRLPGWDGDGRVDSGVRGSWVSIPVLDFAGAGFFLGFSNEDALNRAIQV